MDMRRAKRQVTDIELIKKLVEEVQVVRIALNGEIYPYVVPVNFGYSWDNNDQLTLYVHGAKEGKKVSMLEKNPLVGKAEMIENLDEKRVALELLMEHAAKGKEYDPMPEKMLERVGVIKIELESYTVKQNIHPEKKN